MLFTLEQEFVSKYHERPEPFGFGALGQITFLRTYARMDNPRVEGRERWVDVCRRVTEGTFSILLEYVREHGIKGWSIEQASDEARSFFDLLFNLKWTPPGRGLWSMGTPFVQERKVVESLQNCGFISTVDLAQRGGDIFAWFMEMLMVGVGVGSDMRGAGTVTIHPPSGRTRWYDVPDTRQGWAESVRLLIDSYLDHSNPVDFGYDLIRPRESPINGFGGKAQGPDSLRSLHSDLRGVLDANTGQRITIVTLADLFNLIGRCVVAGNVRRSAEILLGPAIPEFLDLKDPTVYPARNTYPGGWGAFSNNTVMVEPGDDYTEMAIRTYRDGEPGYVWLDNARKWGRFDGIADMRDAAVGGNPCLEQMLWDGELCTLSEIHLPRINGKKEFLASVKAAYLYAKIVTLASEHISDSRSREVMLQNRRIGLSVTGITQFVAKHGEDTLADWLDHGYHRSGDWDVRWSQWLGVAKSIRRTAVKPSGTVALLSGSTPGIHYPISRRYIRRMRISSSSPLVDTLMAAGYPIEDALEDMTGGTVVIEFPIDIGVDMPSEGDVSPERQLDLLQLVNTIWSDNATSITVKFDRDRESPATLTKLLKRCESITKSVSFLPDDGAHYQQMPYEAIDEVEYAKRHNAVTKPDLSNIVHDTMDQYCEGEACEIE